MEGRVVNVNASSVTLLLTHSDQWFTLPRQLLPAKLLRVGQTIQISLQPTTEAKEDRVKAALHSLLARLDRVQLAEISLSVASVTPWSVAITWQPWSEQANYPALKSIALSLNGIRMAMERDGEIATESRMRINNLEPATEYEIQLHFSHQWGELSSLKVKQRTLAITELDQLAVSGTDNPLFHVVPFSEATTAVLVRGDAALEEAARREGIPLVDAAWIEACQATNQIAPFSQ